MQATGTLHDPRVSKGLILVVVAMLCAALLGGLGGYLARTGGQAAGGPVVVQQKSDANQGGPSSDLTRVLPTSAPADPATGYDISEWSGSSTAQPDHGVIP